MKTAPGIDLSRAAAARERASAEPVALVGIGCRYPQIATPRDFWRVLVEGIDAITEIPPGRFDVDRLFDPAPATPGRIMSRRGGFIEDIDRFDAACFGISPREAECLDPQQRLLLEVAWHALDDAGYVGVGHAGAAGAAPHPSPLPASGPREPESRRRALAARTGVFVGLWTSDYEARLFRDPALIDFFASIGSGRYSASGRLSYFFGFEGPCLTLDTACSSSLVAVHLAVQSLRAGECEMALAGGANAILEPSITLSYSQAKMMAPDGRCKFGDARADGYVRSEGAGIVILKRLSRALADGDRIYAVIRGSAVNSDGRSSGSMGRPGRPGHKTLLRRAYADAGVSPARVQYVEAHGTGTRAGDPVELDALGAVLGEGRAPGDRFRVGSVKTNIGHTEGAAGVAGLIKVALSLTHGIIPASLHFETPNPYINWANLPLDVQAAASPWPAPPETPHPSPLPRAGGEGAGSEASVETQAPAGHVLAAPEPPIAGVNSFGIGGTNAHVVVQGWTPTTPTTPAPVDDAAGSLPRAVHGQRAGARDLAHAAGASDVDDARGARPRVLPVSSHTPETLAALVRDYAEMLAPVAGEAKSVDDVCYTAGARRTHHAYRAAFVGGSTGALHARLVEAVAASGAPGAASIGEAAADGESRPVVFVFPGQGSQWIGMGRALFASEPAFRDALERCDAAIRAEQAASSAPASSAPASASASSSASASRAASATSTPSGWSIVDLLHADASEPRLADIDVLQPMLFSMQVALAALWQSWGIRPDAVVGHSMGEVAAACVAGALPLEDAVRVICRRSALLRRTSGRGAMAVVELSEADAAAALTGSGYEDRVAVAVINSRRSTVLSGDPAALDAILARLEAREVFCRRVKVDVASHSPQMDPLQADLLDALQGLQPRAGDIPLYSTVLGTPVAGGDLAPRYWVRNLREPVQFLPAVDRLLADGHVTFVEMSPHPLLVTAVQEAAAEARRDRVLAVGSTRRQETPGTDDERAAILESLAQLYVRGHDIDWRALYAHTGPHRVVTLPAYRWQRERFWYEDSREQASGTSPECVNQANVSLARAGSDVVQTRVPAPAAASAEPQRGSAPARPAAHLERACYQIAWEPHPLADHAGLASRTDSSPDRPSPASSSSIGTSDLTAHADAHAIPARDWVIVGDGQSLATRLTAWLHDHGHRVVDLADVISAPRPACAGVVFLSALDSDGDPSGPVHLREAFEHGTLGATHLVQTLARVDWITPPRVWLVTRGAQPVDGAVAMPGQAALWGLGRVIAEEQRDLFGGLIDLDPAASPDANLAALTRTILATSAEPESTWRAGQRLVPRLSPAPPEADAHRGSHASLVWRTDASYVITGAFGGVGSLVARWAVEQGARRLVLIGRTPLPPRRTWASLSADSDEGRRVGIIRALERAGASVHAASVDASDERALAEFFDGFNAEGWPAVRGVLHCATAYDGALLSHVTPESFAAVFHAKATAAAALDRCLPDALDFFVSFSSIASLLPQPGLASYAAANTALEAWASWQRGRGRAALTISWGVWRGVGVSAASARAGVELFEAQGVSAFEPQDGLDLLGRLLAQVQRQAGPTQIAVIPADWQQYGAVRGSATIPLVSHLVRGAEPPVAIAPGQPDSDAHAAQTVAERARLFEAPVGERRARLERHVQEQVARILRLQPARIDPTRPLGTMGLGSLMGLELRNRLEVTLALTLSATLIWNHPTVRALATALARRLDLALDDDTPATVAAPASTAAEAMPEAAASIDRATELSEEDALRALMGDTH